MEYWTRVYSIYLFIYFSVRGGGIMGEGVTGLCLAPLQWTLFTRQELEAFVVGLGCYTFYFYDLCFGVCGIWPGRQSLNMRQRAYTR